MRAADHVGAPRSIHGDPERYIVVSAAQVRGVAECAVRPELEHERIQGNTSGATAMQRLEGARRGREVSGGGEAGHVGVAAGIDGNAPSPVGAAAADVDRVDKGPRRVELR